MDENSLKLLDSPHRSSRKVFYLLLVLILVVVVVALTFLTKRPVLRDSLNTAVTPDEQMRRLAETPSTGDNPSLEEQDKRLKESPSTNEEAKDLTYEEQLERLKNN